MAMILGGAAAANAQAHYEMDAEAAAAAERDRGDDGGSVGSEADLLAAAAADEEPRGGTTDSKSGPGGRGGPSAAAGAPPGASGSLGPGAGEGPVLVSGGAVVLGAHKRKVAPEPPADPPAPAQTRAAAGEDDRKAAPAPASAARGGTGTAKTEAPDADADAAEAGDTVGELDGSDDEATRLARLSVKQVARVKALHQRASYKVFQRAIQGKHVEEAEELGDMPPFVISPYSDKRRYWDVASLCFIFVNALLVPLWVAFNVDPGPVWGALDVLIDIFFLCDIALNFRTGYLDDGDLVVDPSRIWRNYLRTWFLLDCVATFPYSWVLDSVIPQEQADAAGAVSYLELPAMIRFVRLIRLVRLMRLFRVSSRFANAAELDHVSKTILRITKLVFWVTIMAHVSGCLFALTANVEGWGANSWTTVYGVDPEDQWSTYLSALYWAFATLSTVGYGDVSAHTNAERFVSIVLVLGGAIVFAVFISRISALAASINRGSMVRQRILDDAQEFMRFRLLPKPLRVRMRQYYQYKLENTPHFSESDIIADLSPALRREVLMWLNKDIIRSVPFLRDADQGFVAEVAPKLKPYFSIPGDYLIVAGELGKELFMMKRGEVHIINRTGEILRALGSGSFFGEISLLEGCRRTVSVRCNTNCELYGLSKRDLLNALQQFPTFAEGLRLVAKARKNGKQDPDMKDMQIAQPPPGFNSWEDLAGNTSRFLNRAQQLAKHVDASETKSTWKKVKSTSSAAKGIGGSSKGSLVGRVAASHKLDAGGTHAEADPSVAGAGAAPTALSPLSVPAHLASAHLHKAESAPAEFVATGSAGTPGAQSPSMALAMAQAKPPAGGAAGGGGADAAAVAALAKDVKQLKALTVSMMQALSEKVEGLEAKLDSRL